MKSNLTEDQVRDILLSTASHQVMGSRYGVHRSTISLIRLGKIRAECCPDLPRWQPLRHCTDCIQWQNDHCGLGFPDPLEEGLAFARECTVYQGS